MSPALPSLHFQPQKYCGGLSRFYLPLFYDLVALDRPGQIVVLGFGDGQPHAAFEQALREHEIAGRCLTIRRELAGEKAEDDDEWQRAAGAGNSRATFRAGNPETLAADFADGSVDILLLDDCDSAAIARAELQAWGAKLAPHAVVLFHGLDLERRVPLGQIWEEAIGAHPHCAWHDGIGLGMAVLGGGEKFAGRLAANAETRAEIHAIHQAIVARMDAENRAQKAERRNTSLELRQVWLDTVLSDRWKAQEVMDHQARGLAEQELRLQQQTLRFNDQAKELAERTGAFTELHRDRMKAQLVMDTQSEQLKQWVGIGESLQSENGKLKAQLAQEKRLIRDAKNACRKRGECFGEKKKKRPIPERIMRELQRIPGKFRRAPEPPAIAPKKKKAAPVAPLAVDRYAEWIAAHEPDAQALAAQRNWSSTQPSLPLLSLLLPTFNPPAQFLAELIAALAGQTYEHFEICVADGGSNAEARAQLEAWQAQEPRLRLEFLPQNLGIAENTNRALALARGEFFTCIDQDDLLPPFALYEMAQAIRAHPETDIFYSDEDRLGADGKRHAPFFKPEWSPAYLLSSMYIGHLTAYRRTLAEQVGGYRKEYDLSQDYDFALRATEQARAVGHIPHVLYHWREHAASGSAGGKPQARTSNLAALGDAMKRRGLDAEILEYPSANRARMKLSQWPMVSIIVPTDSPERARACLEQLPQMTAYPDYEIVLVINSGLADALEKSAPWSVPTRLVRYDEPFNFSDKSNRGAQAASGSRLIFFNDDVESGQPDWIQNLIEPLENPEVGAVSPKLLYESGKIQHAGLVMGVRGLVGTACHQWPGDSTDYTNFAQSMRDAAALSAACLAMRRDDFFAVGEFDAINTPIAHSDLDLCFKVRAAGMRCVYTPFATMTHRGHASIGAVEAKAKPAPRDHASLFLLQRWPEYTCHDPYFPPNMRDWLYADSPTPIRMWAPQNGSNNASEAAGALLLISHDLSWSGAPLILLDIAKWLRARGYFVVVMSPVDGPLREKFREAGLAVIVDPLVNRSHPSLAELAREFDGVVASTIFGAPVIRALHAAGIPHLWWIHEGRVAQHYLNEDAGLRLALSEADFIITPDTVSAQVYQPFTERPIRVLPYGIPDPRERLAPVAERRPGPIRFLLLGTIEHRKGQRVLLEALAKIPHEILRRAHFDIVGRPHDPLVAEEVRAAAQAQSEYLSYSESVSHTEALELIQSADVMLSCSWDETGPLILMEALALGTPILSTTVGAVGENLVGGTGGLFFAPGETAALAEAITRLVQDPQLLARLTREARGSYEQYFTYPRFGAAFEALLEETIIRKAETRG